MAPYPSLLPGALRLGEPLLYDLPALASISCAWGTAQNTQKRVNGHVFLRRQECWGSSNRRQFATDKSATTTGVNASPPKSGEDLGTTPAQVKPSSPAPGAVGGSKGGQVAASVAPSRQLDDYGMVLRAAMKLSKDNPRMPDKEVGMVAGVPEQTLAREARIYSPGRTASQQGHANTLSKSNSAPAWRIDFDSTKKWENHLIGWTSSADPIENVMRASLFFYNKEEAIAFCEKHGWPYTVDEPNKRRPQRQHRFMGYGDNFSIKRSGVPDLSHLPSERGSVSGEGGSGSAAGNSGSGAAGGSGGAGL